MDAVLCLMGVTRCSALFALTLEKLGKSQSMFASMHADDGTSENTCIPVSLDVAFEPVSLASTTMAVELRVCARRTSSAPRCASTERASTTTCPSMKSSWTQLQ